MDQEAISAAGCRMERLHCGYLPPTYICARQQELTPDGCKLSEKSKQWPNSTANAHCPESTAPTCLTILPKSSHIPGRILLVIMSSFILSTAYLLYVGWNSLSLVVSIAGQSSFAESWPDPSPSHARGGLTYNFLRLFRSTGPSLNLELHYPYGMPPV